jgi:hypothetical protein
MGNQVLQVDDTKNKEGRYGDKEMLTLRAASFPGPR